VELAQRVFQFADGDVLLDLGLQRRVVHDSLLARAALRR
jgi:hypothetical protein